MRIRTTQIRTEIPTTDKERVMTSLSEDKNEVTSGITSYKHPVFDGEKPSEYKDWWDNVFATLEMNDLEEYVTDEWKDKDMPTKISADLTRIKDKTKLDEVATCDKNKLYRKEMKKAKAHMVKVTKGYAKRLVMDAKTPYEAYSALKKKYSVSKVLQDFTKLDNEWNEFKVTDPTVDPDKVFATLDEQSTKLKEFGDRYKKYALQMISKLGVAMPDSYTHIFSLLNTDAEHKKSPDVQLATAKRLMQAHYNTDIAKEAIKEGGTMMCMYVASDSDKKYKSGSMACDHCKKGGHTAYKDGKPFCFALIAALKGEANKSKNNGIKFKGKCLNCQKPGHRSSECRSPKKDKDDESSDVNNLMVANIEFEDNDVDSYGGVKNNEWEEVAGVNTTDNSEYVMIATIVFDETEINQVTDFTYMDMLGDTGAQGHVFPPTNNMKKRSTTEVVNMANGSKSAIYQRDNCTIEDEVGNEVFLNGRRVVGDIVTPILSLTQLIDEGWTMKSGRNKTQNYIYMDKNGSRLTFVEKKKNLFYLTAKVTQEVLIANYTTDPQKKTISFKEDLVSEPKLPAMKYSDAHHKWGHHGEERLRKMAKTKGLRLIGKMEPCDACGIVKVKAKPISTTSDPSKKATDVGERLFVDITGPFPLTATKWHKATRNKLFWYGISDQFSGKMISAFNYNKQELVELVDETFKYFKGRAKPVQYLRMDNAGENQAVAKLCKEQDCIVEFTPPDTPKLNNMVERGFAIRWEIAKTLMQNAGLKNKVKMNKKIIIEAIKTASFLNDECPQKGKAVSVNELFFGTAGKDRVKVKDFVEWGRIGFVANKRTRTKKSDVKGTAMMMVGYSLNHPSGTYRLYNPQNDTIIDSNSVTWSDFKPWQAANVDSTIGELKKNETEIKIEKEVDIQDNDDISGNNSSLPATNKTILAPELPPDPPAQERRVTRQASRADPELQKAVNTEYNEATNQTYKVTGDTVAVPIIEPTTTDNETGGTEEDMELNVIWTEDLAQATKNLDGVEELVNMFLYACVYSIGSRRTENLERGIGRTRTRMVDQISHC